MSMALGMTVLTSPLVFALPQDDGTTTSKDSASERSATGGWQASPELVAKLQSRPDHPYNYDESKVPDYELPKFWRAETPEDWQEGREATLQQFRQSVYGIRPLPNYNVTYNVEKGIADPTGGKASGKLVRCRIEARGKEFSFPFLIYLPREVSGHVPLIVLIHNREFPNPDSLDEQALDFWPVDAIIEAGYATAVFHTSDVDPDRADGYEQGIRGFLTPGNSQVPKRWGSLSAWGWAASRVLDYGLSEENIDPERTAVVGHSRGGKTALWAAAEDTRFQIAYSNESGCGGAALSRRRFGETVARITASFPHWFCPEFSKYANHEDRLPVDQHQLIGLLAPRAVYVASADQDLWADPRGEYLSLVNAAPIFKLLGKESIEDVEMPGLGEQRIKGVTGYHIRPGEHNLTRLDWEHFLKFAKLQFGR